MKKKRLKWRLACLGLVLAGSLALVWPVLACACGGMDHGSGSAGMDHSMMGPMSQMGPGPVGPAGVLPLSSGASAGPTGPGPGAPNPGGSSPPPPANPADQDHSGHSGMSTSR